MGKERIVGDYAIDSIQSIMEHASRLPGTTLREWGIGETMVGGGKGRFGQALEAHYFLLAPNSKREADFRDAGLELKTTPLKKTRKGFSAKERLVLGIINFDTLLEEGWDGSFYEKNGKLLIVFYLHDPDKGFLDYPIKDAVLWEFPNEDFWIIKGDWEKIARMVREGRAHEISERHTVYLKACVKGAGHGRDYRTQPFSDEPAHQRAFSLGSGYVTKIWNERHAAHERYEKTFVADTLDYGKSFEENVLSKFQPFLGMRAEDIETAVGASYSPRKKDRYAALARKMLGVDTAKVEEFVAADIMMKTVRLSANGRMREHMSFPYFRYAEFLGNWEDSVFFDALDKKFLFVVYKMDGNGDLRLHETFFWEMPQADLDEVGKVWERTRDLVLNGDYDSLPGITEHRITHVRPHARDVEDTTPGLDGIERPKKCFWLNNKYIESIIEENKRANR